MECIQRYRDLRSRDYLDEEEVERLRKDASKAWDVMSKKGLK